MFSFISFHLEGTWLIRSHENQNRFCRLEFRKGNGLHGDDNNGGNAQRCRRVQTKQSSISLLQSYKLLVS